MWISGVKETHELDPGSLSVVIVYSLTHVQLFCDPIDCNLREGNGTPLQYSYLENPMDGGAWWAAVHGVATSQARLSDFTFTFHFHALEKEMAAHSRVLAWRIPGTGEPGGLLSMGSHRVGHDWSDLAAADCILPGSSAHGVSQARTLEWVAVSFSRGYFWPRDQTHVSSISSEITVT